MRLHSLRAEEQLFGDLTVGSLVNDAAADFELTFGQQFDARAISVRGPRAAVDVFTELAQLAFGGGSESKYAALVEIACRPLDDVACFVSVSCGGQRAPREDQRARGFHASAR